MGGLHMAKDVNRARSANGADPKLEAVRCVLRRYKALHPDANVGARRYNSVSIRVRVIDPCFEGVSRADRDDELWKLLEALPDDTFSDITMLVLLAPSETATSLA